jgi:hypothetical protein
MKSNVSLVIPVLNAMTREDLAGVAKAVGAKTGKSKANTVANVAKAIEDGKLNAKLNVTLSFKPADGSAPRNVFYDATFRTYATINPPGLENTVNVHPAAAVTVS